MGRPFGIPVHISPYWFILAGVFIWVDAKFFEGDMAAGTRYTVAAAFVVLLYVSVLIHELGHSLVARGFGLPVRRILLYPLGGFSEIEREPPTPGQEFLVTAAGPVLSLVLGIASWCGTRELTSHSIPWSVLTLLMLANLFVAAFNALPGLPLDGGRMLHALIWKITGRPATATIAAA